MKHELTDPAQLEALVAAYGFLPFFRSGVPGFSVEEHTPPQLWFSDTEPGPWEWKGPIARGGRCVYGKFFERKAGFVSLDWFPDFANFRRDGYDFDARYDDGLAQRRDKQVYDTVVERRSLLSKELKRLCDYREGGNRGFDTVITRLQMQTYIIIADFEYMRDKNGRAYGWGVARYSTPEAQLGEGLIAAAYARPAVQSRQRILAHLTALLPDARPEQILRILG